MDIQINLQAGDDAGLKIQQAINQLPDVYESYKTAKTQTICVSSNDCYGRDPHLFEASLRTKPVIPYTKQVEIKGTGKYGIVLNNESSGTTMFDIVGTGVGTNHFISDLTLKGGGITVTERVRGACGVNNVKVIDSDDYAVRFLDGVASGLGPVNFHCNNLYTVNCKGSVDVGASTYLLGYIYGGRTVGAKAESMRLSGRGIQVDNHDFTSTNGICYLHLHAETDSNQSVKIERCRFGSEAITGNTEFGIAGTDRPANDIIIGSLIDGDAPNNPSSSIDIWNNTFSGGSGADGTLAESAIRLNDRPRQIRVMNGNQFDSDYSLGLIYEAWLNDPTATPLSVASGERNIRAYWGMNTIRAGSKVFSNGGVGWDMPFIDSNFTDHTGSSKFRMVGDDGQHYIVQATTAGLVQTPVAYV